MQFRVAQRSALGIHLLFHSVDLESSTPSNPFANVEEQKVTVIPERCEQTQCM